MKKLILFTIILTIFALTGCIAKVAKEVGEGEIENNQRSQATTNDSGKTEEGETGKIDKDEEVEDENLEDEVNKSVKVGNENIKIFGINSGDNIISPATIEGEGRAFENNLQIELRNKDHVALVKEFVTIKSSEAGEIGSFIVTLSFEFSNTKEGYLAVYEQSAEDGSELNLVEIPVKFREIDISDWQTYRNEEFGVEFQCPLTWIILKTDPRELKIQEVKPNELGYGTCKRDFGYLYVNRDENINTLSEKYDDIRDQAGYDNLDEVVKIIRKISIGDKGGDEYKYIFDGYICPDNKWRSVVNNNVMYNFSGEFEDENVNSILETFKFINN